MCGVCFPQWLNTRRTHLTLQASAADWLTSSFFSLRLHVWLRSRYYMSRPGPELWRFACHTFLLGTYRDWHVSRLVRILSSPVIIDRGYGMPSMCFIDRERDRELDINRCEQVASISSECGTGGPKHKNGTPSFSVRPRWLVHLVAFWPAQSVKWTE